jgi:hypothetical protein
VVQNCDVRFNILVNIALTLAEDRIPNVRLALCQLVDVLRNHIVDHSVRYTREQANADSNGLEGEENGERGANTTLVLSALRTLLTDRDRDVQYFALQLRQHIDADYEQYKAEMIRSCNNEC